MGVNDRFLTERQSQVTEPQLKCYISRTLKNVLEILAELPEITRIEKSGKCAYSIT